MREGCETRAARVPHQNGPAGTPDGAPLARLERVRLFGAQLELQAIVAMPVRQEAAELPSALPALARSLAALPVPAGIALLVNNTRDASAEIACEFGATADLPVFCFEATLDPLIAHAGHARRFALDLAAAVSHDAAVLLSTDADTVVSEAWAPGLCAAVRDGASLALATVEPDAAGLAALPEPLQAMAEVEEALYAAQARLWRALLPGTDPLLGLRASGAGMAVDARAYRRIGGVPIVASGEDRAMARALQSRGEPVAVVGEARARTSCRLASATEGGMAATLARRAAGERTVDADLMPAGDFVARTLAYGYLAGRLARGRAALERRLGLAPGRLRPDSPGTAPERWFAMLAGLGATSPMTLREAQRTLGHFGMLAAALPVSPEHAMALADGLTAAASGARSLG